MQSGISSSASDLANGESGGSDLADLAGQTPICCHQGDGAIGEACFGQCFRSGQWGNKVADVPRSSQARGI